MQGEDGALGVADRFDLAAVFGQGGGGEGALLGVVLDQEDPAQARRLLLGRIRKAGGGGLQGSGRGVTGAVRPDGRRSAGGLRWHRGGAGVNRRRLDARAPGGQNGGMEGYRRRLVLGRPELEAGLDALGRRLGPALEGRGATAVCILGGAVIFAADLVRRLPGDLRMDFLRIRTYGSGTAPGRPPVADWLPDRASVEGREILLLDDILDTGRTLQEARRLLLEDLGAASVRAVVLVDKPARRAVPIEADDAVLRLEEDLFLVGYGLDLDGRYRNLPELWALEPAAAGAAGDSA